MLEHLPFSRVPLALSELARAASRRAVGPLPQSGRSMRLHLHLPSARGRSIELAARAPSPWRHAFDGQHYWQVGTPGTHRRDVRRAMRAVFSIEAEYMVAENLYHRFYVLTPRRSTAVTDS